MKRWIGASLALMVAGLSLGQIVIPPVPPVVSGVGISTEGVLSVREVSKKSAAAREGKEGRGYVSLAGVMEEVRKAKSGVGLSTEARYLGGLTRVDYLFVYPEAKDLVIAGPVEELDATNPLEAVGKLSGRPALQVEDLIVALRAVESGERKDFYGCSLNRPANTDQVLKEVIAKYQQGPRGTLVAELKKRLGPQGVRVSGVPEGSRMALVMLAADYRLKRWAMGVDAFPVAGVGNAVAAEEAVSRMWFSPSYEPVLVAADGLSYELRGVRLKVEGGQADFVATGASEATTRFVGAFSEKMAEAAKKLEAVADLQNVADLLMVASLIKKDGLMEKAGADWKWVMKEDGFQVGMLPAPRTAETVVSVRGATLVTGGVGLRYREATGRRAVDEEGKLAGVRKRPVEGWKMVNDK